VGATGRRDEGPERKDGGVAVPSPQAIAAHLRERTKAETWTQLAAFQLRIRPIQVGGKDLASTNGPWFLSFLGHLLSCSHPFTKQIKHLLYTGHLTVGINKTPLTHGRRGGNHEPGVKRSQLTCRLDPLWAV
jgi:hypothetical protein